MVTDTPPRKSDLDEFRESDRITTLDIPNDAHLPEFAKAIESAMKAQQTQKVRTACAGFLKAASQFYNVPECSIRVLASRPLRLREHWTTELFGDYAPDTKVIRVWMRTAVRKEITSFGTFLSTVTSFAIISIFRSSGLPTRGTRVDSMSVRPCFTITRAAHHRSA